MAGQKRVKLRSYQRSRQRAGRVWGNLGSEGNEAVIICQVLRE